MVAQRELDERLRAVAAQLEVEERDWQDEERKLFELEETYLRDTAVHGNLFTGWGDAKTAPIRFRNAALRRKKRERQDPLLAVSVSLSTEEQLKVDRNRAASYSSMTSPAEPIRATIEARAKKAAEKAADKAEKTTSASGTSASAPSVAMAGRPSPSKKARK